MGTSRDRREDKALRSFRLIEEALDPDLTDEERSALVAGLVEQGVALPDEILHASRATLYRYLLLYKKGGLQALKPKKRIDAGACRALPERVLKRAISLRHIMEKRDTPRVIKRLEQLFPAYKGKIKRSTLDRHLSLANASRRHLGVLVMKVRTRFQALEANNLWTGDVMHARTLRVVIPGAEGAGPHKIYLISWIDDYSRYVPHSEWYLVEHLPTLEDCFKKAVLAHGLPTRAYSDKGSIYEARMWIIALSELRIHKIKTRPRSPQAHGKIEKWHQTARKFEEEAVAAGLQTLADVNRAWWAYLRVMYHGKPHSETNELPSVRYERFTTRRFADPHQLTRLFLIREDRTVNSDFSTVSVRALHFRVDPMLRGRRLEVRFDPYALDRVYIWQNGREVQIARPASKDNLPQPPPPADTQVSPEQRQDSRAFLNGIIEEADQARDQALPGLHLAAMADSSSLVYSWNAFTNHLSSALGRTFDKLTEAERSAAHQLWQDHGPLNRHWVQAALTRALASKGSRQHLTYYLDQIKLIHFNEAPPDGPSKPVAPQPDKGRARRGGTHA